MRNFESFSNNEDNIDNKWDALSKSASGNSVAETSEDTPNDANVNDDSVNPTNNASNLSPVGIEQGDETDKNNADVLDDKNIGQPLTGEAAAAKIEEWRRESFESAKFFAKDAGDTEKSFCKSLGRHNQEMSEKEFRFWEKDYSGTLSRVKDNMYDAGVYRFTKESTPIEKELIDNVPASKTIEAYAGNFFNERYVELHNAIKQANNPEAKDELRLLDSFEDKVFAHVDTKFVPGHTAEYLSDRMAKHNAVITTLNKMNDLARKYGTTPFTARDFFPCSYESQGGLSHDQEAIASYDRDVVEAYYNNAFSKDIRKITEEQSYYGNMFA